MPTHEAASQRSQHRKIEDHSSTRPEKCCTFQKCQTLLSLTTMPNSHMNSPQLDCRTALGQPKSQAIKQCTRMRKGDACCRSVWVASGFQAPPATDQSCEPATFESRHISVEVQQPWLSSKAYQSIAKFAFFAFPGTLTCPCGQCLQPFPQHGRCFK